MRDRIIQTENDYDKDVIQRGWGDHGAGRLGRAAGCRFDDRLVRYDFGLLEEVAMTSAVTIHKSYRPELLSA
jgi:hypothetical protein